MILNILTQFFMKSSSLFSFSSFLFIFTDIFRSFYTAQFVLASSAIRARFRALSNEINRRNVESANAFNWKPNIQPTLNLGRIFQRLSDSIDIVNETFTFQFIFTFAIFLVLFNFSLKSSVLLLNIHIKFSDVFAAYGIVNELFRPSEYSTLVIYLYCNGFFSHSIITIITVYFGCKATEEAKATIQYFSNTMNIMKLSDSQKIDIVCLITQMKLRNINFQNMFFRINWSVVLAVSIRFP